MRAEAAALHIRLQLRPCGRSTLLISEDIKGANCLAVTVVIWSWEAVRSLFSWCQDRPPVLRRLLLHTDWNNVSCLYESTVARRWDITELLLDAGGEDLALLEVVEGG